MGGRGREVRLLRVPPLRSRSRTIAAACARYEGSGVSGCAPAPAPPSGDDCSDRRSDSTSPGVGKTRCTDGDDSCAAGTTPSRCTHAPASGCAVVGRLSSCCAAATASPVSRSASQ